MPNLEYLVYTCAFSPLLGLLHVDFKCYRFFPTTLEVYDFLWVPHRSCAKHCIWCSPCDIVMVCGMIDADIHMI